ncbi:MAG: hypothetical protein ABR529_07820 [Actinomycetota bacterium]
MEWLSAQVRKVPHDRRRRRHDELSAALGPPAERKDRVELRLVYAVTTTGEHVFLQRRRGEPEAEVFPHDHIEGDIPDCLFAALAEQ